MADIHENTISLHVSTGIFDEFSSLSGTLRELADQEIADCMWKLQAVHHHSRNVQILEQLQLDSLRQKSKALDKGWFVIGSEPNPLLRFEFEAQLQQIYAALNIAACALVKMLRIGQTCGFRDLEKQLNKQKSKFQDNAIIDAVKKCIDTISSAKKSTLSEFFLSQSLRDKVVHFHCLRARPIQILNKNEANLIITAITKDNVIISSLDDREKVEHKVVVRGQWSESLSMEFVVFGTEPHKWPKEDSHVDMGAIVGKDNSLNLSEYSQSLLADTKKLIMDLFQSIIEANNSLPPHPKTATE